MLILIVAATAFEIAPVVASLDDRGAADRRTRRYARGGHEIDVMTTGVGMVATAAWLAAAVARETYDLLLSFGLCGTFDPGLELGRVVHVVTDCLPELGAEDGEGFLTMQELNLLGPDEFPYSEARLVNRVPPDNRRLNELPAVDGITVNTVHGRDSSIAAVAARFKPQVESMEGAAFMYVCLSHGLPFAQIRAISNVVERRNRAAWRLDAAVDALGRTARGILDSL